MTALIVIGAIILVILILVNIPVTAYIKYYGGKADISVKYAFVCLFPKKEKKKSDRGKKSGKNRKRKKRRSEDDDIKRLADMYDFSEDEPADESTEQIIGEEKSDEPVSEETHEEIPASEDKAEEKAESTVSDDASSDEKAEKKPLLEKINEKLDELQSMKESVMLLLELVGGPLKRFCGKIRIDGVVIDLTVADEDAADAALTYGKLGAAVYNGIAFLMQFIKMTFRSVSVDCLYNTPKDSSRYDAECKVRLRPASLLNAVFAVLFRFLIQKKKYAPVLELINKKK